MSNTTIRWDDWIHPTTTDVTSADAENTTNTSGWTTIATPNRVINLMSLQGGVTTNLGTTRIASA